MKLIVLDDERGISTFIATVARDRGWTVETALDEATFQAMFTAFRPDAIVLDLHLAGADGVEQLRFLSARKFTGAIMLLSGFDARVLAAAKQRGESLGLTIAAALEKPIRIARLREVLDEVELWLGMEPSRREPAVTATPLPDEPAITPDSIMAALRTTQMELHLQPIVAAGNHAVLRFEALCRWRHPTLGMVVPDRFIPVAERDERAIDALTAWVIETALAQHRRLLERGYNVPISVNVSGVNLRMLNFPDWVATLVGSDGVASRGIGFEITESAATRDPGQTTDILARLRLKGFALAMDDFGTGYSSLKAVQQMPFSELKIDKSFVAGLPDSSESLSIVDSVIRLARDLGMECVAEGVETVAASELLARLGATALQGYLFSRALPFDQAVAWLDAWPARAAAESSSPDHRRMCGK